MIKVVRDFLLTILRRKNIIRGATLAIAFLIAESIGFLLLIRVVSSKQGPGLAGQMSLLIYLLTFVTVIIMSLGVVVSREIAGIDCTKATSQENTNKLISIINAERLVVFVAMVFLSGVLAVVGYLRSVDISLGGAAFVVAGFYFRSFGLLSAFKRLGLGNIGADKGFSLQFSVIFYASSIIFVQVETIGNNAIPLAYALAGISGFFTEGRMPKVFVFVGFSKNIFQRFFPTNFFRQSSGLRALWIQYFSMLFTACAGFMVTSGDAFMVSSIFGSEALASYSVAAKLSLGIFAVASIYPSMQFQPIADSYSHGNVVRCRKYWYEGMLVALVVSVAVSLALHFLYPFIAEWTTGHTGGLNHWSFSLLCVSAIVMASTAASGWAIIGSGGAAKLAMPTILDSIFTVFFGCFGGIVFGLDGLLLGLILAHATSSGLHFAIASKLFRVQDDKNAI